MKNTKYLLLQARKYKDPMIKHEIKCFSKVLKCDKNNIQTLDLIREEIDEESIKKVDVVIIGGSGDFSIAEGGPWMQKVLDVMNYLYENSKITFASCWGFQAMAKARGGEVVKDLKRAELGTVKLHLTDAGEKDIVFQKLPKIFMSQMGHEDIVNTLPENAVLLASSKKVKNEAFMFKNKPIYCTQFHPELSKDDLKERMQIYPNYVKKILGISQEDFFKKKCFHSNDTKSLITNFIKIYLHNS